MNDSARRALKVLGILVAVACWVGVFISVASHVGEQWDLKTYGYATHAFDRGLNPYQKSSLLAIAGPNAHPLPFVYPLSTLYVLRPVTWRAYEPAHRLWLIIKFVVFAVILLVWKFAFLRRTGWLWLLAIGFLAFQSAISWDIRSGNVGSVEQLLLWSGFACLAAGVPIGFALLVTAASFFKLTLAVFLLLLLLPSIRKKYSVALVGASILLLAGVTGLSFAGHPDYFRDFLHVASATPGELKYNPCALGVATDIGRKYPALASPVVIWGLWLVFSVAVLYTGRRVIARAFRSASVPFAIMIACFVYALVVPRFMLYSYMLLIVPVLAVVLPAARRMVGSAYAVALIVCLDGLQMLPPSNVGKILKDSEPFLALCVCWFLLVYAERKGLLQAEKE